MTAPIPADQAATAAAAGDPFVTGAAPQSPPPHAQPQAAPPHLRYAAFDAHAFALGPGTSAEQARRALEAHLADTERRMEEAGKLGTALVQQRKELTDRLREVEQLQAQEAELHPELRQRLAELEKEYNEVARESARAFLPKQRVPSNEGAAAGSPFAPEGKGGRRSVSPSKFESQATGSPTKLSVPNRKLRNQPASRVHDIEFAAEISTSLIAQVRNLQALLAERDEELRDAKAERSRLERDVEAAQQRLQALDESEHRYKDENWNLETQIHDLLAAQRDAADREKRLAQALHAAQADKAAAQRELDEVRLSLSRLDDRHAAAVRQHDIELGTLKRRDAAAQSEKAALQRRIDDLTSQNQELARAFSAQRGRAAALERDAAAAAALGLGADDGADADDHPSPEHSPPPSPIKGTPRHAVLESETLKTSLHHAQRTLQSMRTIVHREKTEKLELKRMLQDARDELERLRGDPGSAASHHNRRSRKTESREFAKRQQQQQQQQQPPKLGLLGGPRASRSEIYADEENDPDWEDHVAEAAAAAAAAAAAESTSSEHFETANETSDAAFETAHERGGTETEDFHTGAEEFSDDDDDAPTETEMSPSKSASRRLLLRQRPPVLPFGHGHNRYSFQSTASTEDDDDDDGVDDDDVLPTTELKTPTAAPAQRMRLRVSRGALNLRRSSRVPSEEPTPQQQQPHQQQSSPASFARSASGTPQAVPAQSLFAELGDDHFDDDESSFVGDATPSRRSTRGWTASPPAPPVPARPRVAMVDSGTMTEPVRIEETAEPEAVASPRSVVFATRERPLSTLSYSDAGAQHDPDMDAELAKFPSPPTSPQGQGLVNVPILAPPPAPAPAPSLDMSAIVAEQIEPVVEAPPALQLSALAAEEVVPVAERPPSLHLSAVAAQEVEPVREAPPALQLSGVSAAEVEPVGAAPPDLQLSSTVAVQHIEPLVEQLPPPPTPPPLQLSAVAAEEVRPLTPVELPPPVLSIPQIRAEVLDPVDAPAPAPVPLSVSSVHIQETEPVREPELPRSPPPVFSWTPVHAQDIEPVHEPARPPPPLVLSSVVAEHVEPVAPEEPRAAPPPPLSVSPIQSLDSEPREPPFVPVPLGLSSVQSVHSPPVEPEIPPVRLPSMGLSRVQVVADSEPLETAEPAGLPPSLSLSSIQTVDSEPFEPRSPRREAFIIPRDTDLFVGEDQDEAAPRTPQKNGLFAWTNRARGKTAKTTPDSPVIAEDETRQSLTGTPSAETPESQRPLQEVSGNADARPPRSKPAARETTDQGAQTSLTSEAIDAMLLGPRHERKDSLTGTPSTVVVRRRRSGESFDSVVRHKPKAAVAAEAGAAGDVAAEARRPGSAASGRASLSENLPPLPPNHREAIEAAKSGGSSSHGSGGPGSMGPPLMPASAYRNANHHSNNNNNNNNNNNHPSFRPWTPTGPKPQSPVSLASAASGRGTPTPRAPPAAAGAGARLGSSHGPTLHSPARTTGTTTTTAPHSRRSSVSSFVSELDTRFNLPGDAHGAFHARTDPRMIQAITETMIGEYLWKYTRKAGRGGQTSERRHRRYFWVHPYTRTLYWSDRDPTSAATGHGGGGGGRAEVRAKSVPIEAVRVVTDDNPLPPGLHRKSLIVVAPGRTVKITCTTGQRHETWFNALSYLLLRSHEEEDASGGGTGLTREDVAEFNPSLGGDRRRRQNDDTAQGGGGSGSGRKTTLLQHGSRSSLGTFSRRVGDYLRGSSTVGGSGDSRFASLRSRSTSARGHREEDIYGPGVGEAHDSAEELRLLYERQDREADRLENVRACCDGKHDVGTLPRSSKRGRHSHGHARQDSGPSTASTPMSTLRSRP